MGFFQSDQLGWGGGTWMSRWRLKNKFQWQNLSSAGQYLPSNLPLVWLWEWVLSCFPDTAEKQPTWNFIFGCINIIIYWIKDFDTITQIRREKFQYIHHRLEWRCDTENCSLKSSTLLHLREAPVRRRQYSTTRPIGPISVDTNPRTQLPLLLLLQ